MHILNMGCSENMFMEKKNFYASHPEFTALLYIPPHN